MKTPIATRARHAHPTVARASDPEELGRDAHATEGPPAPRLRRLVALGLTLLALGPWTNLPAVEPFLEGLVGTEVADTGVDAQGFAYVLAKSGSIRKFDTTGLEVSSTVWQGAARSGYSARGFCVASDGYIYVVEPSRIQKISQTTGAQVGQWTASLAGVSFKSVVHRGSDLYVCGEYTGGNTTWEGLGVVQYASSSSMLVKLPAGLENAVSIAAVRTWGFAGVNRANSVVVDQTGNVYVGGQLGSQWPYFLWDVLAFWFYNIQYLASSGFIGLDPGFFATGPQGYVAKWNADLSAAQEVHVVNASLWNTFGGEVTELVYAQGWIYAVGSWQGYAHVEKAGVTYEGFTPADWSPNNGPALQVLKLDTTLRLSARATARSVSALAGRSLTADDSGNVYFAGAFGPGAAELFGASDRVRDTSNPDNYPWGSISAPAGSVFVAKLNSGMNYQWVQTPSSRYAATLGPVTRVRWNPRMQRLFWAGTVADGSLTLGNAGAEKEPPVPRGDGFMAVFEPDGAMTERARLTIFSDYGASERQVRPFGGPGTNIIEGLNTRKVIKGSAITASVPGFLYRDLGGADITDAVANQPDLIDAMAETRIKSTGYSVGENVANGTASSYTFTLNDDTQVTFNWEVEHALRVNSDLSGTVGTGSLDRQTPGLPGLTSLASGSPMPEVKKHWIAKDESVIAQIDGDVVDLLDFNGLPVKYVVLGYRASGPPNTRATGPRQTDYFVFPRNERRQQVPEFIMSGPASIEYVWKLKIGVQVNTTSTATDTLPVVRVLNDPGRTNNPPTQPDGVGAGTFYYDEHTELEIGSMERQNLIELQGWLNGDGNVIPGTGQKADLTNAFNYPTAAGARYLGFRYGDWVRPAKVMWNYGTLSLAETVALGNPVMFSTVTDPAVRSRMRTDLPPEPVELVQGPQGSTAADMGLWDDVAKRYMPLRPGTVSLHWRTTDNDPNARIVTRITITYPAQPHFRHLANTAPVNLDPEAGDMVAFDSLRYTETTTGAAVGQNNGFTATNAGKTVLLFREISSSGRGGSVETFRVRVVETKRYDHNGPPVVSSWPIGQKITSAADTACLDTGFVFNENAAYNPFIYDRAKVRGPIIPVNLDGNAPKAGKLVVAWYERRDKILWPYTAIEYTPQWPTRAQGLDRIVVASRFGNESVATNGTDQLVVESTTRYICDENGVVIDIIPLPAETSFNPSRFQQVAVYHQPSTNVAGYNPNEEHGLVAPSLRSAAVSPRPPAIYALRLGDLNNKGATTSQPYVLAQFFDTGMAEFRMKVYEVVKEDANLNLGLLSYNYRFEQTMDAGEPVIPFYPLVQVIGATPCSSTYGRDGNPSQQVTFWKDHKGTPWAISGNGSFHVYFFYPLQPDFWWPAADAKLPGDCVAWLPNLPTYAAYNGAAFTNNTDGSAFNYTRNDQTPPFQSVKYTTRWPENLPVLKVGETLTFAGGEFRADHPTTNVATADGGIRTVPTEGLPGVVGWASGEVIFDSWNPATNDFKFFTNYTARLVSALEERSVPLTTGQFPPTLQPANKRTRVEGGKYVFLELSSSLQKRVRYDPLTGRLGFSGLLNDKSISDPTLTAAPPAVYVLEPNIMTEDERVELDAQAPDTAWKTAVTALYNLSRNPNGVSPAGPNVPADGNYRVGLEQRLLRSATTGLPLTTTNALGLIDYRRDATKGSPQQALGPGLALVTNPDFLDPDPAKGIPPVSYVTLAENNHPSLGSSPVALHIIRVDKTQRYRGAIKTVLSDNVFDENIILRHTADFGANPDALVFEWWYRPEDGTDALPPDKEPAKWKLFADPSGNRGRKFYQLKLKGNPSAPEVLLADTLFYLRYRHTNDVNDGINWTNVLQPDGRRSIPYQWAGAGNSSPEDLNGDGLPDYRPQLAQGWVKRVLDAVNPYEARIRQFEGDNPATYASMIQQFGQRFEGPVALNPDKNVIENVGLIELYETILKRARDLSIDLSTPISTPGISTALQLASTRLGDFYMLLGNEAYVDALNPTIGLGSDSAEYGHLAPAVFAFQNQVSSLLEEELALLRGQDDYKARPVYNRLFWNFVKGEGEAAYAMNYNIRDVNNDGFIDEDDGQILYPQGHGDAWGHYLTAIRHQYDLLSHPYFNWVSRSELYNLQDIVLTVDFLDERKFAQVAAAKARAGAEILNLTYRSRYVEHPDGQWQGYTDNNRSRAWGVDEWARRAGQGAYFDWITANALLPAQHPNTNLTGIQKVDRTTVQDLVIVAANLTAIQQKLDEADAGNNPLGLEKGALTFDIDPTFLYVGSTAQVGSRAVQGLLHFDQMYERAVIALKNAKAVFDYANQADQMLRQTANSEEDFRREVFDQDLAYRNQLIEIFGTPYEGTIGSGKAYPPGYLGPDVTLYMYTSVRDVSSTTVPQPAGGFTNLYYAELGSSSSSGFLRIDNSWRTSFAPTFSGTSVSDFVSNFTSNAGVDGFLNAAYAGGVALTNLDLPITVSGYTFQAPPEWGIRRSPGELQNVLSQMLQAEADLAIEISNYGSWQSEIIRGMRLINARYDLNADLRQLMVAQIATDTTLEATALGFKITSALFEIAGEASATAFDKVIAESIPKNSPVVGLAAGLGDVFAPIRGAANLTGEAIKAQLKGFKIVFDKLADVTGFAKELADRIIDLQKNDKEKAFELKEALNELQNNIVNDNTRRIEIFKKIQALREASEQYRATLGKGNRLLQERKAYNQKVAALTQQRRYQDMTLRVSRNAALEKYRSAFDLAARYAYFAATAYDYDTNLGQDDAGSPVDILADIVRQRSVGVLNGDDLPAFGGGGLAEDLAWLRANYETLKPRLGLNTPQIESTTFSLRREAFRTLQGPISDTRWQQMLRDYPVYRTNLWEVPEFRAYCRPFSAASNGPQPGLVLAFSTQIGPNKNFFGWPLGGGDSAYDPSVFATKLVQAGVWFAGYDATRLSSTPRVYLVPAGQDIMTVPTSLDLEVRVWHVLDQAIPVPFPSVSARLDSTAWRPLTDSLTGPLRQTKRFSSFRAAGFDHDDLTSDEEAGVPLDYRLVGRSAWNTRWLLIIPGATLSADPEAGLAAFIESITDIKLLLNTYGLSGN